MSVRPSHFHLRPVCLLLSGLCLAAPALAQQAATDVGNIDVQAAPGGTESGLIQQEDTPKARSSVSRSLIERSAPTANPFQLINELPGVNAYSYDATGLWGGGLRVRGLNSDQLGFTVNGAPVNDSGNFAVYPQEYTDSECVDNIFVTQGSTDTEAPHVGASGGNIGIVSSTPADERNLKLSQTGGSDQLDRTAVRYDTGRVLGGRSKFLVCASHSQAEKFKGPGRAEREHLDVGAQFELGKGSRIGASLLYNDAVNANFRALNKSQIANHGTGWDFGSAPPVLAPAPSAAKVVDPTYGSNVGNNITGASGSIGDNNRGYYGFNLNPFRNAIATMNGDFKLASNVNLNVNPYYWWGYGTGGNELKVLTTNSSTGVHGGISDIYGYGNGQPNVVWLYNGSVTHTNRPGVNSKLDIDLENQHVTAGIWYEKAHHRQTGPYTPINSSGQTDIWLNNGSAWARYNDGTPVESRNYYTVSTGEAAYASDSIELLDHKLNLVVGGAERSIKRDFFNYASSGGGLGADYQISRTYSDFLPNLGLKYQLTPEQSAFFNVAKNLKAPANFVLGGLVTGGTYVKGVLTNFSLREPVVTKETAIDYDLGYRAQNERYTVSGSVYLIDFNNRIATSYDPASNLSIDQNVGKSTTSGVELEAGLELVKGLSLYGSATYTNSRINDNKIVLNAARDTLPTSGKQYPDTPQLMAALAVQYGVGGWAVGTDAKYTGRRYTTLVNDDRIGGYTQFNANFGYTFAGGALFRKPSIRLNVYNLFGREYLNLSSGSGSSFTNNALAFKAPSGATIGASAPSFYVSAPRAVSITVTSNF